MNHHLGFSPVEDYGSEGEAKRILAMVARCAPRLMRTGGGPLKEECYNRGRPVPVEVVARVLELRRADVLTVRAIAAEVGFSRPTVENICRRAGLARPPGRPRRAWLTPDQKSAVRERIGRGDKPGIIARELGINLRSVYKTKNQEYKT